MSAFDVDSVVVADWNTPEKESPVRRFRVISSDDHELHINYDRQVLIVSNGADTRELIPLSQVYSILEVRNEEA